MTNDEGQGARAQAIAEAIVREVRGLPMDPAKGDTSDTLIVTSAELAAIITRKLGAK